MPIIGFTSNPSALVLQLTPKSVVAKRISLPRTSPYFEILESKPFDFGWENNNILVICDPTTASSNDNEFELLFLNSMLPHATKGEFFLLFSIIEKQNDVLLAGSLTLNDYATAHKFLRIRRRREKYLPILWK